MFDITVVGHNVIDTITRDGERFTRPGGAVTYCSLAASWLGSKVAILSKAGHDYPQEYVKLLDDQGVDTSMLIVDENKPTTKLLLGYGAAGQREIKLIERCSPVSPRDIPDLLLSKVVHIGTVVNEVSPDIVSILHSKCPCVSVDLQGFVRSFSIDGVARIKKLNSLDFLAEASIVNGSEDEVVKGVGEGDLAKSANRILSLGVKTLVATLGNRGSIVFSKGTRYSVPAFHVSELRDPTGAGDSYIGAFLSEFAKGSSTIDCATIGTAAASIRVESGGLFRSFDLKEVRTRSKFLLKQITERRI